MHTRLHARQGTELCLLTQDGEPSPVLLVRISILFPGQHVNVLVSSQLLSNGGNNGFFDALSLAKNHQW